MDRHDLDTPIRMMTAIWLVLTAGIVLFAGAIYVLLTTGAVDLDASLDPALMAVIAPLALVMMAAGLVLGRRLQNAIAAELSPEDKIRRYQTARIIALASQEGPVLAVGVLSLLTGSVSWVTGVTLVGVWTMFLARPRRDDLEALLRP